MRKIYHFIKAAAIFARHQAWPDSVTWGPTDAAMLGSFFATPAGERLRRYLAATVVLQQAEALNRTDNLKYEAGYCAGQRGLVAIIEGMADKDKFTEQGETEADPATTQEAS